MNTNTLIDYIVLASIIRVYPFGNGHSHKKFNCKMIGLFSKAVLGRMNTEEFLLNQNFAGIIIWFNMTSSEPGKTNLTFGE